MTPFYILLAILGIWLGYKAIVLLYYSIKGAVAQANMLEQKFGTNVWWAARYTMGLPVKDQDHHADD